MSRLSRYSVGELRGMTREQFMLKADYKPVSDLRNKFADIENIVKDGEPVFLTKNGYGSMVVLSIEAYSRLTDGIEEALDKADRLAEESPVRISHEEGFANVRRRLHD